MVPAKPPCPTRKAGTILLNSKRPPLTGSGRAEAGTRGAGAYRLSGGASKGLAIREGTHLNQRRFQGGGNDHYDELGLSTNVRRWMR
jgi:hypothetical protein